MKLYPLVVKAYENKEDQDDRIEEYWNIYNAQPDENQTYNGNSQGYIPAVRDALNARAKRALKQLFPVNHKHVDGISSDGKPPFTQLALLEHYIRKTKLKSIVRTDLIAGDVTGQWNLMVDWLKTGRTVTKLVKRNPVMEAVDGEEPVELEIEAEGDEVEDTEDEEVTEEGPDIVDFATEDLAVIPPTQMDLQIAKAVSLRLRLSVEAVTRLEDEGVFILPKGTEIEKFCKPDAAMDRKNRPKKASCDAGVKTQGTDKYAVIFMVYSKLDLGGERKDEAVIFYAGPDEIVGIIKNPFWSGKRPILSKPVERIKGSFFGKSKIEPVKFTQWNLTDFWNMGQDSAMYSLLPIFTVDPLTTPNWAQLTMGLAAIWPGKDIKPLTFAQLWKDAAGICDLMKRQIWESLDVNEMMMGKMPQGRKNNQMMGSMQQEQQVNITDHATRYEDEMLNPLCEMLFEFDQQFRTKELMIEQRGEIGVKAAIETIPVPQWGQKYFFRWAGTEFMMGMQRMQQQIAWMNVLKGIPPQVLNGRVLDVTPILEAGTENLFGPEMGPRILIDKRNQYAVDPEMENEMMHNGFAVLVHEADDDQKHLAAHMKGAAVAGDPMGIYKTHMVGHMEAIQKKRAAGDPNAAGAPGGPGGAGPGVAGAPRPGAMPAPGGPRPAQNPPGAVQADQMADGAMGPRG